MARTAVVAGTATAVVGHSQNKQAAKQQAAADAQMQDQQIADMQAQMDAMQAQQAQQAAPPPPPAPAAAPAAGGDLMAELSKLADLKAAGVLTDEEFAAAKAKLLA
jgi:multidrug resistance efflux pump